jgi:amino acid transporter
MGRERVLPHWLGQLHPRWNTPWRAIGLGIAVVGVLVASWIRGSRPAVWADMGTVFDEV